MTDASDPKSLEGWVSVLRTSTDYEADLVRDRLDEANIPAVVYTQRDHTFNLNVGDLSPVNVMVPPEHEAAAREVIAAPVASESELEQAAMAADVEAPDAHSVENEAMLDSALDALTLSLPDEVANAPSEPAAPGTDVPGADAPPPDDPNRPLGV